jgi:hypothetical protein
MNQNILLAILLLITISACTVYKEYPIDVYKPGEISIPTDAKNVALIYRNFKYPGDTLQSFYKDNYRLKKARTNGNLDSILVKTCLTELAKNFKEKNKFNEVKILPYDLFKRHTSKKLPALDFAVIKKITSSTHSDLLISLETYSYFFSEYPQNYDPMAEQIIERKALIDTIYWNGYDAQGNYQKGAKLPPRETALKIASQLAGENYAKRFLASWQTVNRTYSIPPLPDFSDAAKYVDQGKWDNAIHIWKNYASDKNGKLAIKARYNLALAYEMKDDFVLASRWLEAAQNLAAQYRSKEDLKMILSYRKILQNRINDIQKLNQK